MFLELRRGCADPPPPPSLVEEDQKKPGVNRVKQLFLLYSLYELLMNVIRIYNLYFAYWYINCFISLCIYLASERSEDKECNAFFEGKDCKKGMNYTKIAIFLTVIPLHTLPAARKTKYHITCKV